MSASTTPQMASPSPSHTGAPNASSDLANKKIEPFQVQLSELPADLKLLPNDVVKELVSSHTVLSGFMKSLPEYKTYGSEVCGILEAQVEKLNQVIAVLKEYNQTSVEIDELIIKINEVYAEFTNHELIQYKLLSANFNQDFLKARYKRLIEQDDKESRQHIKNIDSDMDSALKAFKESRKRYHLRSEKLNRWNEDRVTGFI